MLKKLVYSIVNAAFAEPLVESIVYGDVYRLNQLPHIKYGVVTIEPLLTTQGENLLDWRFRLVYTDRLTNSKNNTLDVQSTGIDILHDVVTALGELDLGIETATYQTYTQRFKDECAGAYVELTVQAPRNFTCVARGGGDFNVDFNEDFTIYKSIWNSNTNE